MISEKVRLFVEAMDRCEKLDITSDTDPLAISMGLILMAAKLAASDPVARVVLIATLKKVLLDLEHELDNPEATQDEPPMPTVLQ